MVLILAPVRSGGADWHQWRGPFQNGFSPDRNLPERWSPDQHEPGSNLAWKAPFGGRTTPIVMNGRVYLINDAGEGVNEQERVMCFDADTGKVLWEHRFNVFFTDIVSVRVGWTVLAGDLETGNIYAHGTQGLFFCFDRDGKVLWQRSLTEEYGRISGYGGRLCSPVVDGDLVIIGMLNASWGEQARGANRFLAMDKQTGAVVWWASTGLAPRDTYSSVPVVADINGERLLVTGGGDGGVHAFKVRTGERVWTYRFSAGGSNISPVVEGTRVFIGHGEDNPDNNRQGRVICLDAGKVKDGRPAVVWDRPGLKIKFSSPILHEGRLYVCDDSAQMFCLDAETGKTLWRHKYGRNAKGSPVLADGKIYVGEVNAKFHILKPGEKKCEELSAVFFPSPDGVSDVEINGSAAVANGRVYFMTRDELFCIGRPDGASATANGQVSGGQARGDEGRPTLLQIVPADVELEPGGSAKFSARLFDDKGNFLKETEAQWSVAPMLPPPPPLPDIDRVGDEDKTRGARPTPPPSAVKGPPPPPLRGTITPEGQLTVAADVPAQFGGVVAQANGLTSRARVRVAPRLPYRQDFEKVPDNRTPGGWVNTQGKFAVRTMGDSKVLVKLAQNASPLVARAHAFIGMPNLSDYTIHADVQGQRKHEDMPDLGVVACRYTLQLDGNKQRLRLLSWDAVPRVEKNVDWPWQPGVWYRLKLSVTIQGDKALVRGKAWKRGEEEPRAWTIEFDDPTPNREGSPALYGYATGILEGETGAEAYYDNVNITPNKASHARAAGEAP
jgi:outer membrane protein assembly factor BamB